MRVPVGDFAPNNLFEVLGPCSVSVGDFSVIDLLRGYDNNAYASNLCGARIVAVVRFSHTRDTVIDNSFPTV